MGLGDIWDELVNCIVRPPRDNEYRTDELLGGTRKRFFLRNPSSYSAVRHDLELVNKRGLKLQCSHYIPENVQSVEENRLPCVIYCHCNSGSRRDAEEALHDLLPMGISVFTMDFAGSGLSEGQWVTLGAHEVDDVETVVQYLRKSGTVSTLALWGRSMGAVTALLYSHRDPSIAGMVLDSPFSSLTELMLEIVEEQQLPVPKALMKVALSAMKRSVRKRADFDISEVTPLNFVGMSHIPVLFIHGEEDKFIKIHHSEKLFAAYAGEKSFKKVKGEHNSVRPTWARDSATIFLSKVLQAEELITGGNSILKMHQGLERSTTASHKRSSSKAGDGTTTPPAGPSGGSPSATLRPGQGAPWQVLPLGQLINLPPQPTQGGETGPLHRNAVADGFSEQGDAQDIDSLLNEEEAQLARAIAASLQEQPPPASSQGSTGSQGGAQAQRQQAPGSAPIAGPQTPEEEEAILQQVLALSLQEVGGASGAPQPPQANGGSRSGGGAAGQPQNMVDLLDRELGAGLGGQTGQSPAGKQ